MSIQFKDNEYYVRSGDIDSVIWTVEGDSFSSRTGESIPLVAISIVNIVKDDHYVDQSAIGRVGGAIIGGVLLGGIGAAAGLLSGGRKRISDTEVYCVLDDGRSFYAKCSQAGAAKLLSLAQINSSRKVSAYDQKIASTPEVDSKSQSSSDRYECANCAELIKINAKVCRFCGYVPADTDNAPRMHGLSTNSESKLNKRGIDAFVTDYRNQVRKSPFLTDDDIINTLSLIIESERSDISSVDYRTKIARALNKDGSREFKVSERHLEQLCSFARPVDWLREKFGKSLSDQQFNDLLNAVLMLGSSDKELGFSECREFLSNELKKSWGQTTECTDVARRFVGYRWLGFLTYQVSDMLVFVNPMDRNASLKLNTNSRTQTK